MAKKSPTFEESLTRLEEIVEKMERGDLSLDESLALFKEGVGLSQACIRQLDEAEKQIRKLVRLDNGKFALEPFAASEDETPPTERRAKDDDADTQETTERYDE